MAQQTAVEMPQEFADALVAAQDVQDDGTLWCTVRVRELRSTGTNEVRDVSFSFADPVTRVWYIFTIPLWGPKAKMLGDRYAELLHDKRARIEVDPGCITAYEYYSKKNDRMETGYKLAKDADVKVHYQRLVISILTGEGLPGQEQDAPQKVGEPKEDFEDLQ